MGCGMIPSAALEKILLRKEHPEFLCLKVVTFPCWYLSEVLVMNQDDLIPSNQNGLRKKYGEALETDVQIISCFADPRLDHKPLPAMLSCKCTHLDTIVDRK